MERLREIREHKGFSQAKLAVLADMNPATLWRYETGQRSPTVDQLEKLAEVLGVEVSDFFPKDQAPLPLNGERNDVFGDAIALAAGKWLENLDALETEVLALRADDSILFLTKRSDALSYASAAMDLMVALLPYAIFKEDATEEEYDRAFSEVEKVPEEQREEVGRLVQLLTRVNNKGSAIWNIGRAEEKEQKEPQSSDAT